MKRIIIVFLLAAMTATSCTKEPICAPEKSTYKTTAELRGFDGAPLWISRDAIYDKFGGIAYFVYTYKTTP